MLSDQSKKHLKASITEKNQQDLNQKFPISPTGLGLLLASSLADFLLKQVPKKYNFECALDFTHQGLHQISRGARIILSH